MVYHPGRFGLSGHAPNAGQESGRHRKISKNTQIPALRRRPCLRRDDTGKYQKILKYPRFDDDLAAALEDVGDQSILVIAVLCFLTERNVQRVTQTFQRVTQTFQN